MMLLGTKSASIRMGWKTTAVDAVQARFEEIGVIPAYCQEAFDGDRPYTKPLYTQNQIDLALKVVEQIADDQLLADMQARFDKRAKH